MGDGTGAALSECRVPQSNAEFRVYRIVQQRIIDTSPHKLQYASTRFIVKSLALPSGAGNKTRLRITTDYCFTQYRTQTRNELNGQQVPPSMVVAVEVVLRIITDHVLPY